MALVQVEVGLDDFDDAEILLAALCIVREKAFAKLNPTLHADFCRALEVENDDELPPISTAAKIKSLDDLRAWKEGRAI